MILAALTSAIILARIYDLSYGMAILGVFAWVPTTTGIIFGQSAPLGLLLETLGIAGIVAESPWLAAVPIGLLLYKPTDAVPFIVLLAARRSWRALSIVGICVVGWYIASAFAAAGDPLWPLHYLQAQRGNLAADIGEVARPGSKYSKAAFAASCRTMANRCVHRRPVRARGPEVLEGVGVGGRQHCARDRRRRKPSRMGTRANLDTPDAFPVQEIRRQHHSAELRHSSHVGALARHWLRP